MSTNQGQPWRIFGALAVVAAIALIAALSQIGKSKNPASSFMTPATDASAAAADAAAAAATSTAPEASASWEETAPPIGGGLVLDAAQMRYCLSEKVRVNAVRALVRNEMAPDVTTFNAKVDDYNARCGSFQYPSGLLDQVTTEVEQRRTGIEQQARTDWLRTSPTTSVGNPYDAIPAPATQPSPPQTQAPAQPEIPAAPQSGRPESGETFPPGSVAPDAAANPDSPSTPP
jgi:hypothetical protein